jgi:NAD(P)H-binding
VVCQCQSRGELLRRLLFNCAARTKNEDDVVMRYSYTLSTADRVSYTSFRMIQSLWCFIKSDSALRSSIEHNSTTFEKQQQQSGMMVVVVYLLLLLSFLIVPSESFSSTVGVVVRRPPPPPAVDVLDTKAFAETTTVVVSTETKDIVSTVVVVGATGRTGRYVVEELLQRNVQNVMAMVRDTNKANTVFPNPPSNLQIIDCDLCDVAQIAQIMTKNDVDAVIWCATGFSEGSSSTTSTVVAVPLVEKLKRLFGVTTTTLAPPKQSIDLIGLPAIAKSLHAAMNNQTNHRTVDAPSSSMVLPKIVMCSSAGVTRTIWNEDKKVKFSGAADIPIVRLNPFNILDRKRESEELLRSIATQSMSVAASDENSSQSRIRPLHYCIVRPCGLNDAWPANSRPIFTQGDVAVGRLHRRDLAKVLVDVLSTPEATDKTFEVVGIAGYPRASLGIGPALARLKKDSDCTEGTTSSISDELLFATYTAMQQLLPGETQDAAALAMGQTYEQLDTGTVGRLGVRGQEDAERAAPKPSS